MRVTRPFMTSDFAASEYGDAARAALITQSATVLYVNPSGNDANDGSVSSPLQTLPAIYKKSPPLSVFGPGTIVHLAAPSSGTTPYTYEIDTLYLSGHTFRSTMIEAPVSLYTAALDAGTPTTAATNRTRLNFTTAAPGWDVNEARGYFARIKRAGVLRYPELPISQNDADHLWINVAALHGDILSTDTVEIVQPGAKIAGTNVEAGFPVLRIIGDGGPVSVLAKYATFERIQIGDFLISNPGLSAQFDRCLGTAQNVYYVAAGVVGFRNVSLLSGQMSIFGASVRNGSVKAREDYTVLQYVDLQSLTGLVIGAGGEAGQFVMSHDLSVYDSSGAGIAVSGVGSVLMGYEANNTIQGSGNVGVGIHATRGGRVRLFSDASNTSITGTAGDLKVGNGAVVAYGTGAGQFREAIGWNGNLTRILEGTATSPLGDSSQIECVF